jgi:Protein of unknown function (DUF993)
MSRTVTLPDGPFTFTGAGAEYAVPGAPFNARVAYAAAPVVADPLGENVPGAPAELDWTATLAFRRHLWAHGFGVAEAMDTAQRGMGLDYPATRELIRRSAGEARVAGGRIVAGVATDQLPPGPAGLDDIRKAYAEQLHDVQQAGAIPVLMCSRHLAAAARDADDYLRVYGELLHEAAQPVILHWLGAAFDPALAPYWVGPVGGSAAVDTVVRLIGKHRAKVDGIKMSLLDAQQEIDLRRRLPDGVRMYTGDDFHYPELIRGDAECASDALLGIFDAIAPAAAAALTRLDEGDADGFEAVLEPTLPLARHLFSTPTSAYKTGIVFLAWLAGHQDHFRMVGGQESARSIPHLAEAFVLADQAGLLGDRELASARMRALLEVAGVAA